MDTNEVQKTISIICTSALELEKTYEFNPYLLIHLGVFSEECSTNNLNEMLNIL